jgi:hypothetical protein
MAVHDGTGYDAIASRAGTRTSPRATRCRPSWWRGSAPRTPRSPADDTTTVRFDGHVSYERVCSGRALPTLYAFHRARGTAPESPALAARLAAASDPTPVIVDAGLRASDADALCQRRSRCSSTSSPQRPGTPRCACSPPAASSSVAGCRGACSRCSRARRSSRDSARRGA